MDSAKLEATMACVDEHDMAVDSIVVVLYGRIVFEEYGPGHFYGFTLEYPTRFFLEEKPILDQETPTDASGIVQITSTWEPFELVSVLWSEVEGDESHQP
jgi:hypothetical protein